MAYQQVLQLFEDWRAFEEPVKTHDAPDYSPAAREAQFAQLAQYRERADAIDVGDLTRAQRVDLEMIRCEMNGFEYTHRFFRPWERDPCYYNLVRAGGNDIPGWHVPHMHNVLIPGWLFRCEGFATAFEELLMQSGLEDSVPRARELVHICAAFRAARALAALRVHGKGWTLQQAIDFAVKYTPKGWLKPDGDLIKADMNTYLRQPEYGPSYTVGKVQVERLIADRVEQLRDEFSLGAFFKDYLACGMIPASLIRWELTGKDDELKKMGVMW